MFVTPTSLQIESGALSVRHPDSHGIYCFKGIPYAAPPLGAHRFAPPQPVSSWTGVRATDRFGHNAVQNILFSDIDPFADGVSEDCLTLNVWTGAKLDANEKRAVLFWVHGGGFVVGSGSEPRYNGTKLAARGVVVVTVNHRLNAFGYLAHPALTAEHGSSGNYAMLDLIAALRWVQQNISAFGGDPARVTIAGESAGSMACSMLMCSPLAKGLFAGVIGQSGAGLAAPAEPMMTLEQAEREGQTFVKKFGASTLQDLRAVSAQDILDAAPGLGFRPIIDGHVLTEHPRQTFAKAAHVDVPMIAGWNKDEGFNFDVTKWGDGKKSVAHWVNLHFGKFAKDALVHYPVSSLKQASQSARDLGGDLIINHGTWSWLEAQRAKGKAPLYRYCFDHVPKTQDGFFPSGSKSPGAFHSCELPYVFDVPDALGWHVDQDDAIVAGMTADYWANFIKTGNPNGDGLAHWPSYRDEQRPCLRLAKTCTVDNDIDGARHRFMASAFAGKS